MKVTNASNRHPWLNQMVRFLSLFYLISGSASFLPTSTDASSELCLLVPPEHLLYAGVVQGSWLGPRLFSVHVLSCDDLI